MSMADGAGLADVVLLSYDNEEEETFIDEPAVNGCFVMLLPELIVPLAIFSLALDCGKFVVVVVVDGLGCVTIVSLIESMLSCDDTAIPARCCFFFFAKSYMSPNMPAKVLRRFFIVSSASSTTDDCCVGRDVAVDDGAFDPDCDDCDACESRRVLANDDSELSMFAPLKLPWRAIDPTPGVCRSGMGGGGPCGTNDPVIDPLRGPAETGGVSSVGLAPREFTAGRD
jgi:hypothetical protein